MDDFLCGFRCVQAWLLEKPAMWAEADVASLAAALMVQRPPARACEDASEVALVPKSDWTVVGITAAYLLAAPSQQLADMPAPPPPTRREAAGRSCPRPWPRRRPSGILRTRTTAASCGASSHTASGSRGSPGDSGQTPQAARAPSSTPSWPAASDAAPRLAARSGRR